MTTLPALLLLACTLTAATEVVSQDTGDGGAAPGDGGGEPGDTAAPDPGDEDGDGWSQDEGDCDDLDPAVNPGARDTCDGRDTDCDGALDEDAIEDDPTEPNDTVAWSLGDLAEDPELQAVARLHNDNDVDRFSFELDDSGWGLFELRVAVANIPTGSRYRVVVEHLDSGTVYLDEAGEGTLSVEVGDELLDDDGGTWAITVSAEAGAACDRDYLVGVVLD